MTQSGDDKPVREGDQIEMFGGRTIGEGSSQEESRNAVPSELQSVKTVIAEFKKLTGPLQNVTIVKLGTAETLEKLDLALTRLPSGDAFGQKIDELRKKAREVVAKARRERIQNFRQIETNFLKSIRDQCQSFREQANGWRIGPLELQVRPEQAQCRWLFDREVIAEWSSISSLETLQRSMTKSIEILNKAALPESVLKDIFWEAYQECVRLQQGGKANPELIPLPKFYRQLRLTLVGRDLAQRPDKKLSHAEFPKWMFLYNLDLYRRLSPSLFINKRLVFQTGSQQETESFGMVTNGLDPSEDYKKVCYILKGS